MADKSLGKVLRLPELSNRDHHSKRRGGVPFRGVVQHGTGEPRPAKHYPGLVQDGIDILKRIRIQEDQVRTLAHLHCPEFPESAEVIRG